MVVTNPTGNDNTYSDFAYNTSSLKANLDIEMPLSLIASQLTLMDTVDFVAPKAERQSVKGGILKLIVNNGFPLDASLRLYFLNGGGVIIDSLISSDIARAAPLSSDMRASGKTKSTIHYAVSEQRMQALYRFSKVIVKAKFSTQPPNTHLKIYSDYSIDFTLVGDFSYNVQLR
jgi:hypothetical protein